MIGEYCVTVCQTNSWLQTSPTAATTYNTPTSRQHCKNQTRLEEEQQQQQTIQEQLLEQSSWTRHPRTFRGCLASSPVWKVVCSFASHIRNFWLFLYRAYVATLMLRLTLYSFLLLIYLLLLAAAAATTTTTTAITTRATRTTTLLLKNKKQLRKDEETQKWFHWLLV